MAQKPFEWRSDAEIDPTPIRPLRHIEEGEALYRRQRCGQAHACRVRSITYTNSDVGRAIAKNGWGFKDYAAVCKKLNQANAAIEVNGMATVLDGKAVTWATVTLRDKDLSISTGSAGNALLVNSSPGMEVARANLSEVIDDAVDNLDIDQAIASLNSNRKKIKAAYQK